MPAHIIIYVRSRAYSLLCARDQINYRYPDLGREQNPAYDLPVFCLPPHLIEIKFYPELEKIYMLRNLD